MFVINFTEISTKIFKLHFENTIIITVYEADVIRINMSGKFRLSPGQDLLDYAERQHFVFYLAVNLFFMVERGMTIPLILYDILLYILFTLLYGGAVISTYFTGKFLFHVLPLILFLFSTPSLIIVFVVTLILETGIIRLILPKIKTGSYNAPNSKMFYIWTIHLTFNRLLFNHPVKNIILYSVNLRYLTFLALGGKLAYGTSISADVDFVDIPMLKIGAESVIGAGTAMTGHFINKEKITFGKVDIGKNVNIGAFCHIAPNVTIGDGTWIGAECKISPMVHIGSGCVIEPMSIVPPGTRIENGGTFPQK